MSNMPVASLTCDTDPGADATSPLNIVWIESITQISGLISSIFSRIAPRSVSARRSIESEISPILSARMRIC